MRIELFKPLSIHEKGQRPNQEDSLWPREGEKSNGQLFIVCDGMGGHEKGEVASQTFSEALGSWIGENVITPFSDEQLRSAIEYAYEKLDEKDGGEFKKMGTTLTLLYFDTNGVTVAHIGDSRIYHIRPNEGILYQSRDHSLVFDLYQRGEISYEEMSTHPQKNVITKAVTTGRENRVTPDVCHITDVRPDDWFYLCSDGMLENMDNDDLLALFSEEGSDEKKRQKLIAETVDNNDNHTAWMLHVKNVVTEPGDELLPENETTAKWNVMNIRLAQQRIPVREETSIEGLSYEVPNDVVVVEAEMPNAQNNSKIFHGNDIYLNDYDGKDLKSVKVSNQWKIVSITLLSVLVVGILAYNFIMPKKTTTEPQVMNVETDTAEVATSEDNGGTRSVTTGIEDNKNVTSNNGGKGRSVTPPKTNLQPQTSKKSDSEKKEGTTTKETKPKQPESSDIIPQEELGPIK